jgi:integrase
MGKETDKTGYDFHSGCLRNQSMYAVIARSIMYSGRYPTSSLIRVLSMVALGQVAQRNLHFLRHTFASLLIQQGESLVYIKEQMGHSNIDVTVDVYGHLVPGGNRQAVDRLDDAQEIPDQLGMETFCAKNSSRGKSGFASY